jgi:hypothetical protein
MEKERENIQVAGSKNLSTRNKAIGNSLFRQATLKDPTSIDHAEFLILSLAPFPPMNCK